MCFAESHTYRQGPWKGKRTMTLTSHHSPGLDHPCPTLIPMAAIYWDQWVICTNESFLFSNGENSQAAWWKCRNFYHGSGLIGLLFVLKKKKHELAEHVLKVTCSLILLHNSSVVGTGFIRLSFVPATANVVLGMILQWLLITFGFQAITVSCVQDTLFLKHWCPLDFESCRRRDWITRGHHPNSLNICNSAPTLFRQLYGRDGNLSQVTRLGVMKNACFLLTCGHSSCACGRLKNIKVMGPLTQHPSPHTLGVFAYCFHSVENLVQSSFRPGEQQGSSWWEAGKGEWWSFAFQCLVMSTAIVGLLLIHQTELVVLEFCGW